MNADISVTALGTGDIDYTMIFGSVATWRVFSEDGAIPEAGLKLVIDRGREAMKIDRSVASAEVADLRGCGKCTRSRVRKQVGLEFGPRTTAVRNTPTLHFPGGCHEERISRLR